MNGKKKLILLLFVTMIVLYSCVGKEEKVKTLDELISQSSSAESCKNEVVAFGTADYYDDVLSIEKVITNAKNKGIENSYLTKAIVKKHKSGQQEKLKWRVLNTKENALQLVSCDLHSVYNINGALVYNDLLSMKEALLSGIDSSLRNVFEDENQEIIPFNYKNTKMYVAVLKKSEWEQIKKDVKMSKSNYWASGTMPFGYASQEFYRYLDSKNESEFYDNISSQWEWVIEENNDNYFQVSMEKNDSKK